MRLWPHSAEPADFLPQSDLYSPDGPRQAEHSWWLYDGICLFQGKYCNICNGKTFDTLTWRNHPQTSEHQQQTIHFWILLDFSTIFHINFHLGCSQQQTINVQGLLHRKHALLGTAKKAPPVWGLGVYFRWAGLGNLWGCRRDWWFLDGFWVIWRCHKPWQFEMILGRFQDFSYCSWVAKILKQIWTLARPDPNVSRNFLTFNLII